MPLNAAQQVRYAAVLTRESEQRGQLLGHVEQAARLLEEELAALLPTIQTLRAQDRLIGPPRLALVPDSSELWLLLSGPQGTRLTRRGEWQALGQELRAAAEGGPLQLNGPAGQLTAHELPLSQHAGDRAEHLAALVWTQFRFGASAAKSDRTDPMLRWNSGLNAATLTAGIGILSIFTLGTTSTDYYVAGWSLILAAAPVGMITHMIHSAPPSSEAELTGREREAIKPYSSYLFHPDMLQSSDNLLTGSNQTAQAPNAAQALQTLRDQSAPSLPASSLSAAGLSLTQQVERVRQLSAQAGALGLDRLGA